MKNVIEVLKARGFIDAMTDESIKQLCDKPLKVYCGFDPTADSLHLGNMVAIMGLAWFQKFGHTPCALVGGATGMIGDPSGKSVERNLLDEATLQKNLAGIKKNLEQILNQGANRPQYFNNLDWFKEFSFLGFLRDVGKNFRLGPMLAKESVKARLNSADGMSFTEFSYQLLQGYDFLHLFENHGVSVQLGGSDQWGNITAGTDLIRKVKGETCFGVTFPLLTKSDGQKFGKSEKGAIWLSAEKLSPYEFYQHLYRIADEDVIKFMKILTFMDIEEIERYEQDMKKSDYVPNTAQKRLAAEITRLVHGEEALQTAIKVTEGAKPGAETVLNVETLEALSKDMQSFEVPSEDLAGVKIIDVIAKYNLQPSKGEARRLVKNGGVYLNNEKIQDENFVIQSTNLIEGKILLLALGKKNKVVFKVKS